MSVGKLQSSLSIRRFWGKVENLPSPSPLGRPEAQAIFKAIFNAHFTNLVSKEYFSYNVL